MILQLAKVIDAVLTLRDNFSATLDKATKGLENTAKQMQRTGKSIQKTGKDISNIGSTLTKSITLPIIGAGGALVKLASNFDDAYDKIRVGTGATGDALKQLESDFTAVYKSVPSSVDDVSTAIADLNTRLGLTDKPLQELTAQMLNLSRITKTDLSTVIQSSTRMFQDAGIKQKDYSKALDYTFKVAQQTGIGIDRLQQLMTQFGGPLRQMGFDWQTSAAMLGKFEKEGVNTELVVGSLRIALGKMAKQNIKDPAQALQTAIKRIKDAGTAGKANAIALEYFGAKAGPDMAAAIREGRLDLDTLLKTLKNSPDTINKAASDTADFAEKFTVLKNQIAVGLQPVALKLFDTINNLVPTFQRISDVVVKLGDKFAKLTPKQQDMILKLAVMAAAAGPTIKAFGNIIGTVGNVTRKIGDLGKGMKTAGGLMKLVMSPANLVVLAIAAIAVAILLLIKYWGPISSFFKNLWQSFKQTLGITSQTGQTFSKVFSVIGKVITTTIGVVIAIFKTLAPIIGTVFAIILGVISVGVKGIIKLIGMVINVIASIAGFLAPIFEPIAGFIKTLINGVIDLINMLIRAMNKLHWKIPDWVPFMGGKEFGFNIPEIPKLAKGTNYFAGGIALVGEQGPELVQMPRGSKVIPTPKTEQIINNSNSRSNNVTVNVQKFAEQIVVREEADIDKIANAFVSKLQKTSLNYGGAV